MHSAVLSHLFQEELYFFNAPVVVVLPRAWNDYGPDEQSLLSKILTSVKIDLNAVQIVVQPSVELKSLLTWSPARVLIFGSRVQEEMPLYTETAAHGFMVILADDLSQLDDQKKKNLWTGLRKMFAI